MPQNTVTTTSHRGEAPKLHGTFTLTRLAGAGVALHDDGTDEAPELVSLYIGDGATNVALVGELAQVHGLVIEADRQLTYLRHERAWP